MKANDYKQYVASKGDIMAVESMTAFGEEISSDDYTVLYFKDNGTSGLSSDDQIITAENSIENKAGSHPNFDKFQSGDKFNIVVIKTDTIPSGYYPTDGNTWATWQAATGMVYRYDTFTYSEASKTLDGAEAVKVDSNGVAIEGASSVSYNGDAVSVAVTVDGVQLDEDDIKEIKLVSAPKSGAVALQSDGTIKLTATSQSNNAQAGKYSILVLGKGEYENSTATVTFEIQKTDLAESTIPTMVITNEGTLPTKIADFEINGEEVTDAGAIAATTFKFISYKSDKGEVSLTAPSGVELGEYTYLATAPADNANLEGSKEVKVEVVDNLAYMTYGESEANAYFTNKIFNTSKGQAFDASEFKAYTDSTMETEVGVEVTIVDKATNKVVTDCSAPGSYTATVTVATAPDYSIGGSESFDFTVTSKRLTTNQPVVAAAVDGSVLKKAGTNDLTYTGKEILPVIVVKDGNKVLEQGVDYEVEFTNAAGDKVDEILAVADGYEVTVSFDAVSGPNGEKISDVVYTIDVNKMAVVSAKASADFFATDGTTPAVPTFVGYTKADCKGSSINLTADQVSASYRKAVWDEDGGADGKGAYVPGDAVKASELNVAGMYFADFSVKSTVENVKGSASSVLFQVSEIAGYSDVDANAWYAGAVYDAKDLEYMTGIAGTKLFMPEAQITRAEVAQVFFNMAGQSDEEGKFPTQFSDVDPEAWYAQAIAWASQAGVVGGYEGTDAFGTFDNATREQVATMIYRYAKAQGMDVTVEDEAKALSAYTDADQLTFGKTAMAWCVEQGIFGVDTDALRPADNLSRAEMAATAVRVQPEALA